MILLVSFYHKNRNLETKIRGWLISGLSKGEACLAPTFQLINSEDTIDLIRNKMGFVAEVARLQADSS
jgi:hypothetical protein